MTKRACDARYRAKHKEQIRLKDAEYRAKNKDSLKLSKAQYYQENKEIINAKALEQYNKNKVNYLATCKIYREANREKVQSATKAWRIANPERCRELSARKENVRRARKMNANTVHYERYDIFGRDRGICYLCNQAIDYDLSRPNQMSFSIDHIIPISKGGDDTPDNVASSHLSCNQSKHTKVIDRLTNLAHHLDMNHILKERIVA
jgi:5-methylcytosine-specific restriction endonuclease McrA